MRTPTRIALAVALVAGLAALASADPCAHWQLVAKEKPGGVSGMALVSAGAEGEEYLVVHDVKAGKKQPRASLVSHTAGGIAVSPRAWKGPSDPNDLEAIAAVPGAPKHFLLAQSDGTLYHVEAVGGDLVELVKGKLPAAGDTEIEGLSLQVLSGRTIVVWGHRGEGDAKPGVVGVGDVSITNTAITISNDTSAKISVPWPKPAWKDPAGGFATRHVSDLALAADGTLWGSAAYDPGDDGPFVSALYAFGKIDVSGAKPALKSESTLTTCRRFAHKVEAVTIVGTSFAFGADDEDDGGWILPP